MPVIDQNLTPRNDRRNPRGGGEKLDDSDSEAEISLRLAAEKSRVGW